MTVQRAGRSRAAGVAVALVVPAQAAMILSAIAVSARLDSTAKARHHAVASAALRGSRFRPPEVGARIRPPVLRQPARRALDLAGGDRPRALLFIGRCQPCVAGLLAAHDRLWRKTRAVAVVTESTAEEAAAARSAAGWLLPLYPEEQIEGAGIWKESWRPWVMVVRRGAVVYAQSAAETWQQAASRAAAILEGGGVRAPGAASVKR